MLRGRLSESGYPGFYYSTKSSGLDSQDEQSIVHIEEVDCATVVVDENLLDLIV